MRRYPGPATSAGASLPPGSPTPVRSFSVLVNGQYRKPCEHYLGVAETSSETTPGEQWSRPGTMMRTEQRWWTTKSRSILGVSDMSGRFQDRSGLLDGRVVINGNRRRTARTSLR